MTFCFTCFTPTLVTSYSWRRPQNFTTETGGELGRGEEAGTEPLVLTSGTIKRRGSGSPEPRGWCQQRRRLPMSGELTTSLTSPAGGKFPRSSTWIMTSWRTGRVCPVIWHQPEAPHRHRAQVAATTQSQGLPHLWYLLPLPTPRPQHL